MHEQATRTARSGIGRTFASQRRKMAEGDQAGAGGDQRNGEQGNSHRGAPRGRLEVRPRYLYILFVFSILSHGLFNRRCRLIDDDPVFQSLVFGTRTFMLPAWLVVWHGPGNRLGRAGAAFVVLAGYLTLLENLAARAVLAPCRRLGLLGVVGSSPAYLVPIPLTALAYHSLIGARVEAAAGGGLAVLVCRLRACVS